MQAVTAIKLNNHGGNRDAVDDSMGASDSFDDSSDNVSDQVAAAARGLLANANRPQVHTQPQARPGALYSAGSMASMASVPSQSSSPASNTSSPLAPHFQMPTVTTGGLARKTSGCVCAIVNAVAEGVEPCTHSS